MKPAVVLLAALFVCAPAASGALPASSSKQADVRMRTLSNGLVVAVVEDRRAAVVQTAMYYRFGSLYEPRGRTGTAHALEHMMFRGTRAISAGGFDELTTRLGGVANADTHEDYTRFVLLLPSDRLGLALHLEADRMRGLLLGETDWKVERNVVLSEIDRDAGSPSSRLESAVREAAFRGSPFAHSPLGVRSDVGATSAADMQPYYAEYYVPNNATLVVTGDVVAASVFSQAERCFGAISRSTVPTAAPVSPAAPAVSAAPEDAAGGPARVTVGGDSPTALLDIAFRIPGDVDPDAAAVGVVAAIIQNERSQFFRNLVRSSHAVEYNAVPQTSLHHGILHVTIRLAPGVRTEAAERDFDRALQMTIQRGVDPALLQSVKDASATASLFASDSIAAMGSRFGYAIGVERRNPSVDDAMVSTLKASAVNAALRRWFSQPSVIGVVLPRSQAPVESSLPAGAATEFFVRPTPPTGIRLAAWAKAEEIRPLRLTSNILPRVFVLNNGMRLYVQPVRQNRTVRIAGYVETSPADDPQGKAGTGALLSRLMHDGAKRYDFAAQRRITGRLGAEVSFGFQFSARGRARDFGTLVELLADAVRQPALAPADVDLERRAEIARAAQSAADPEQLGERAIARLTHARSDPALRQETAQSLRAITRADLTEYASSVLRPERAVVVVVGDIEPGKALAAIEHGFSDWRAHGPRRAAVPDNVLPTKASRTAIAADRPTVALLMARRAVGRNDRDFYALYLLNFMLGAGGRFDTRLMKSLRTERGLVYGVSSEMYGGRRSGTFEIRLESDPQHIWASEALARAEVSRLSRELIPADELARAKGELVATSLVSEESSDVILSRVGNIARFRLPADYYQNLTQRYNRLTSADLLRTARAYLSPAQFTEVFIGKSLPPKR